MKVWKVQPKPKPLGLKTIYLRYGTQSLMPYQIEVWRGKLRITIKDFVSKQSALDWIELNHKGAEIKDQTIQGPRRFTR